MPNSFVISVVSDGFITAYLGIGANIGDRRANLDAALRGLHQPPALEVVRRSSFYETAPVGITDQPEFLNIVAEVRTTLSPQELLEAVLLLEKKLGRVRNLRWGPRVIDIDILLYGERTVAQPNLVIPHPHLATRAFALQPLAEIAPDARFPDGKTVKKKLQMLVQNGNNPSVRIVQ